MIEYSEGIYTFYTYILTNKNKTVLYTGVTNNLKLRLQQHETKLNPKSFTARYNTYYLVYFEKFTWILLAIQREKEIKNMRLLRLFARARVLRNDKIEEVDCGIITANPYAQSCHPVRIPRKLFPQSCSPS